MFKNPLLLTLPVAIFLIGAFIVLLLALGETEIQLGAAFEPVKVQRHEGIPLAFHGAG